MECMESKMQDHQESGNALLEELEQLKAERDALAAQVEILHEIYYLADGARVECAGGNSGEEKKWLNKLYSASGNYMQQTPQQCLAEIKAEAVMNFAAFVFAQYESGEYHVTAREKYRQLNSRPQGNAVSIHNDAEYCGVIGNAEKYAAKVQQGGGR